MVLFFPNTLTNIDSILTNIIDLPNNNVLFQGDIFKNGPLRFYIDNILVQTLDSTGITISVPKNIVDDFKITGNLVMSTEAGGGKGKIYFTDTINNLTNYITYEASNKIKIQVGDLNINSTNTNIFGNLTLPNSSIITSFINNGAVDDSKLSNTLNLSGKILTLPNNSVKSNNIDIDDDINLNDFCLSLKKDTTDEMGIRNKANKFCLGSNANGFEFLNSADSNKVILNIKQNDIQFKNSTNSTLLSMDDTKININNLNVSGTITLPDNSITSSMLSNNIVDGSKLSNTLDLSGKTISNITLPTLPQKLTVQNLIVSSPDGRLRLSDDNDLGTSYTLIGTKTTDNVDNTRIVMSGFNRSGFNGNIEYITSSTGKHDFSSRIYTPSLSIGGGSTSVVCGIKGRTRIEALSAGEPSAVIEFKPINLSGEISFIYTNTTNNMIFEIGAGIEKMRIQQNGNVGIGITPTEKLHVDGNVKCNNIIADNITSGGGNVQYFDGEIIFKKVYKVSLLKSSLVGADGSTFQKLGLYNYQPIPNPSGFYSIINCNLKYIRDYITGSGDDGLTLQLRGIISNEYDPATDDGNYWLLDEECGYWNGVVGGGGRFSPSSTKSGSMKWGGGNDNFVFLFYGRRGTTTRSNSSNSFMDPESLATTLSNGWQVDTTYSGGAISMDEDVVLHPFMKIEIEQVIYSNP